MNFNKPIINHKILNNMKSNTIKLLEYYSLVYLPHLIYTNLILKIIEI